MSNTNFYSELDLKYPEIAVLLEPLSSHDNKGKFFIPILTPLLSKDKAYDKSISKQSTSNIINKDDIGVSNFNTSNYIEIDVPSYLFDKKYYTDSLASTSITSNTIKSMEETKESDGSIITSLPLMVTIDPSKFIHSISNIEGKSKTPFILSHHNTISCDASWTESVDYLLPEVTLDASLIHHVLSISDSEEDYKKIVSYNHPSDKVQCDVIWDAENKVSVKPIVTLDPSKISHTTSEISFYQDEYYVNNNIEVSHRNIVVECDVEWVVKEEGDLEEPSNITKVNSNISAITKVETSINVEDVIIPAGTRFIIVFVGGDINKIRIIGVY